MRSAGVNDSLSSEDDSADIGKVTDSQVSANTQKTFMNTENRSRYSMNYQSYEATRIQPGEQTRRMLDYMFPGYQKRDPRNWYEMQTQTDLGGIDVNRLIGTELMEGEPIESYEDRKKSIGDSFGDDISDYDGSPAFERKAAAKKGHRSSVLSKAWEGPPIKMSGKSSQEGFHLEVDDYYHEPQTILVPREIIEHQELKMDIVPDDQGVPKVIIYLGRKDPSDPVVQQESPADTIVLFDGKEEFDRTSSDEESPEPTITEKSLSVLKPYESEVSSEEVLAPKEPPAGIRDSLDVVLPNVLRAEPEELEPEINPSEESSMYELLEKAQTMNNSVFLEPIKATGSHLDVYEDVIGSPSPSPLPSLSQPKEPTPPPKEPTPPPKEPSPPPKEPSPPPKEPTPTPKDPTPPPREPSPPPKQPSPPPEEPALVKSISIQSSSPEPSLLAVPSPAVSVESIEQLPTPPTLTISPLPVAKTSIPSQTGSHIGSPPDRLFGPLENYPDDLDEESDKAVHSPPQQMPSPSRGEEYDHPLKLSDDYPPQYSSPPLSSPPREGSNVSNWLETNILNQARQNAKSSSLPKSPQKSLVAEPQASSIQEDKPKAPKGLIREPEPEEPEKPQGSHRKLEHEGDKPKPKEARFMDDERLPNPRALEERFSIFYPPKKPNKRKTEGTAVGRPDDTVDTAENEAVDGWLEDEILNPAAVDNWVDTKILREAKKSSERKGIPQTSGSLRPVESENERLDAWVEDEILQPAKVDNWVSNKIMKPAEKLSKEAKKEAPKTNVVISPPPLAHPIVKVPSPTSSLSMSPDSSASSTSGQSFYEQTAKSPLPTVSPPPPPPIVSPPPIVFAPPVVTPPRSTLPVERRESSDKSVDVNEEEVDSWITNDLLGPAEADAWLEKKVVRSAQAEKWVDNQVIKDATAQNYVDEKIMKPASALSYVDEKIMKPSAVESYIDEKIIEPAKKTESYLDRKIVKPSEAESWTDSKMIEKVPAKEPSPELRESANVTSDMSPEKLTFSFPAPDESLLTGIKTPEKETPLEAPDRKVASMGKPTKQFHVPETYLSDMNLLGPFQPHLDTPDEYPWESSRRLVEPAPKSVEEKPEAGSTKMFLEHEPEIGLPKMLVEHKPETSAQEVQTYPTVEKAETIDTTVKTYPTVEKSVEETSATKMGKSPKQSPQASLISIGRKPSLKQRSGSVDISSMKLHDVEPEKRDRSSILAKKAMEADNYLLRDEEDDYIHPKMTSSTSIPSKRSKSSTSSKKPRCPLSSLFKKKKSSRPGPSLFIPTHKRDSATEKGSGKYLKTLTSVDEEDISLPKLSETIEKKPIKDQNEMNSVPPSGELPEPDGMSEIRSGQGKKLSKSKEKEDGSDSDSLLFTQSSISTTSKSVPSQAASVPKAVPSTVAQPPSQVAPSLPVPASQTRAAPPPQANIPLGLQVDSPQDKRPKDIDFPKKATLVMPEDLHITFPTFSDHEEAMKNQKKPENNTGRKSVPNPAKGGVPVFPDYKQLTDPQNELIVDEEPENDHDVERFEGKNHTSDYGAPSTASMLASTAKKPEIPLVASELQGDAKLQKIPLKDLTESEVFGEKEPKDVKQFEPQKDSEKIKMDSSLYKPTKSSLTSDTHCSAEPTRPGNGIPEFLDYNEITLGQDYVGLKPQNETEPRIDQLSASPQKRSLPPQETFIIHESTTQQQPVPYLEKQIPSNYQTQPISVKPSVPRDVPQTQQPMPFKTSTSTPTQTASYVQQPQAPTYGSSPSDLRRATSLKKYDYSQPDKPLQLVQTPDYASVQQLKPISGEQGGLKPLEESYIQMPPLQKEVPSTFDRRVQQPASLGLPDSAAPQFPLNDSPTPLSGAAGPPMAPSPNGHAERQQPRGLSRPDPPRHRRIPSPDGYISIKQRTAPQSPSSAVTPFGQVQPQGPYGPYSRDPPNQTQQPDNLLYGPAQQQPTYNGPTPNYYSPYASSQKEDPYSYPLPNQYTRPPATTQQPSPSGYSPYGPIDQQSTFSGPSTSSFRSPPSTAQQLPHQTPYGRPIAGTPKEKSPPFQKHTYSHPEQPLPLTPVRPRGFDTDASDQHDDRPSAKRQTTPIEPGGGIPLFPDFDELSKPSAMLPTMEGDFRSAAPRPRTVTAADKKAEFDREIFPLMEQIRDLKRQMYELTPQKGPPMRTGPEHARSLPTSLQLYNELEKRTMAATKTDRELALAERRKQQYEENVRRKIQRGIERYLHLCLCMVQVPTWLF